MMMMQPQPTMMQPAPIYAPPGYAPVPMASPMPMVAAPVPVVSGPTQSNNTAQNIVINNSAGLDGGNGIQRRYVDPFGVRDWSTSLCACLNDLASCACFLFCTPIMFCQVANRMNECAFVCCCVPGGLTAMRVKVRTMGAIKGNIFEDCVLSTCCPCLTICQISRELDAMGLK